MTSILALNETQQAHIDSTRKEWASMSINSAMKPLAPTLFESMDKALVDLRPSLVVCEDIASLSTAIDLATQVAHFPTMSSDVHSKISMAGEDPEFNQINYQDGVKVNIPLIKAGWSMDYRSGLAFQKDPQHAVLSNSEVLAQMAEDLEQLALYGNAEINTKGATAGGLMNGALTHTAKIDIADTAVEGKAILAEVIAMANVLITQNIAGTGLRFYIDQATSLNWMRDYSQNYGGGTIKDRVLATGLFDRIVVVPNMLERCAMFKPEKRFVEIRKAMAPTITPLNRMQTQDPFKFLCWSAMGGAVVKKTSKQQVGVVKCLAPKRK